MFSNGLCTSQGGLQEDTLPDWLAIHDEMGSAASGAGPHIAHWVLRGILPATLILCLKVMLIWCNVISEPTYAAMVCKCFTQ